MLERMKNKGTLSHMTGGNAKLYSHFGKLMLIVAHSYIYN